MSFDLTDLNGRKIYDREAGLLMPLFSLPSEYGIGDLGKQAREFVDILQQSNQQLWALLPNGPIGYGNSPYQCICSCAGNHYYIAPDLLIEEGLLKKNDVQKYDFGSHPEKIDYGKLFDNRVSMLKEAFERWCAQGGHQSQEFLSFKFKNFDWLEDYAVYMHLKERHQHKAWYDWPDNLKNYNKTTINRIKRYFAKNICFWEFTQFEFYKQWEQLREYAHNKGVKLIGDIPFYINHDSADVWSRRELFNLNPDGSVKLYSGLPGENGEVNIRWGNPCYNWDNMAKENYQWLAKRIEKNAEMYDIMRIDHAIAFVHYYGITDIDAPGKWYQGPDMFKRSATDAIDAVARQHKMDIIVENLGNNIQRTHDLYDQLNWIGMRIFNYAVGDMRYGARNIHIPFQYPQNVAAYTGTHDNETLTQLISTKSDKELEYVMNYLGVKSREEIVWGAIDTLYRSSACKVILPVQDVLGLKDARVCYRDSFEKSWLWKMKNFDAFNDKIKKRLRGLTELTGRGYMPDERIKKEGWQDIFHQAIAYRYGR